MNSHQQHQYQRQNQQHQHQHQHQHQTFEQFISAQSKSQRSQDQQRSLNLKYRSHLQPLNASQMNNSSSGRIAGGNAPQQQKLSEAQVARASISQRKSLLMEEEYEFCPTSPSTVQGGFGGGSAGFYGKCPNAANGASLGNGLLAMLNGGPVRPMSPYSTPVKMNRMSQQSLSHQHQQSPSGYLSPRVIGSPSQTPVYHKSPQGIIRRVENTGNYNSNPNYYHSAW